jgi:hypothetical protein
MGRTLNGPVSHEVGIVKRGWENIRRGRHDFGRRAREQRVDEADDESCNASNSS